MVFALFLGVGEALAGRGELVEAEDGLEGVVELARLLEERAELEVTEEGAKGGEGLEPAELGEAALDAPLAGRALAGTVSRVARAGAGGALPAEAELARVEVVVPAAARHDRRGAFDDEGGLHVGGVARVEVSPALFPVFGARRPAAALAGEERLEGLGEARLAGAVAPEHHREAGARREREGLAFADPSEASHLQAREVGARVRRRRGALGGVSDEALVVVLGERRFEGGRAATGGVDEAYGEVVERAVAGEPLEELVMERRGHRSEATEPRASNRWSDWW